jgi:cyclophilin family peptidyl-prolyl cis-trans isomerase
MASIFPASDVLLLLFVLCIIFICRFFITTAETPWLNGKHVVFGRVVQGLDVVDKLQNVAVDRSGRPGQRVVIEDCGVLA